MTRRLMPGLAAFALLACQGGLFSIRISDEAETVVERGSILEELTGGLGFSEFTAMNIAQSQELQNQGVEPGDIEEAELTAFSLEVTEGADLAFLEQLELYVEAPDLPRELVATQDTFPEGETLVEMELTGVDLTEYIVSESMTLTTDVTGNRPEEDTTVVAAFELRVGVTGQGACNQVRNNGGAVIVTGPR